MWVLSDTLPDRVAEIISRYSMASAGSRIGVAVSGGLDSVALLHLLHQLAPKLSIQLSVVHLNHQLRGADSDADEELVRRLAAELGPYPIWVEREKTAEEGGNLEQTARNARRRLFQRLIDQREVTRIATAHTRSDQAETVLMRLLRGSGLAGLSGMKPVTEDGLVRPLLEFSRDEVREWALAQGLSWREDASNTDVRFRRNRLRHDVIPQLRRHFNPNIEESLAATARLAQDEEAHWAPLIEEAFLRFSEQSTYGLILDVAALREQPAAVARRVIRRAFREVKGDLRSLDAAHVEAVLGLCRRIDAHDRVLLPGVDALRSFGKLRLITPLKAEDQTRHYSCPLLVGTDISLPFSAGIVRLEEEKRGQESGSSPSFCANFKKEQEVEVTGLDLTALGGSGVISRLLIRNWEPGDQYQRAGHTHPEKLKTLFQEERVLLWERRHWPVLVLDEEIIWARQFGSAARYAETPASRRVLRVIYSRISHLTQ